MSLLRKIISSFKLKEHTPTDPYKEQIAKYLPENPVILEAGACDGIDTKEMSALWPKSTIHAFEPLPSLFQHAKVRLAKRENIRLYPYALSDKCGSQKIHISSGASNGSSSLMQPLEHLQIHPTVVFNQTIEVEALTIDAWADKYNVARVDCMWLDLQGMEYKVLSSSPGALSTCKVIFTEVSLVETYKGVMLYPEFRHWLESQGFSVVFEDLRYADMGNILFVRL